MPKRYAGDQFFQTKTEEQAREETELLETVGKEEGAVDFDTYFATTGKKDPSGAIKAAMRAFTNVTKATPAKWSEIFANF